MISYKNMGPTHIIAVIPSWNRKALLKKAIDSLLQQSLKPNHIIVLDNGSTDGSKEYLESLVTTLPKEYFSLIINKENTGAAAAMHTLLNEAFLRGADWVWILDDDGEAETTALEKLISSPKAADKNTGILMPQVIDGQGNPWIPAQFDPKTFSFNGIGSNFFQKNPDTEPVAVQTGGYCGLLIHKRAMDQCGLPETNFYLWYDDVEYIIRVSQVLGVWLIPDSIVHHHTTYQIPEKKVWPFRAPLQDFPDKIAWRAYYMQRNYIRLAMQYAPSLTWLRILTLTTLREIVKPWLLRQSSPLYRTKNALKATWHALTGKMGPRVLPSQ